MLILKEPLYVIAGLPQKGYSIYIFAKFLYVQMCILIFVEFKNKATSRLLINNELLWLMYFSIDTTYFQTHPIDKWHMSLTL